MSDLRRSTLSVGVEAESAAPSPLPDAEAARLAVLESFGVLDTDAEAVFDSLTELAAQLCGTPMALISLVTDERQWFKSRLNIEPCQTSLEDSFCAHALGRREVFVIPDTALDPRFADNVYVVGEPHIRFYASAPLITSDGHVLGSLCVLDRKPGSLSDRQQSQLTLLAQQVMAQLVLRKQTGELAAEIAARQVSEFALQATDRLLRGVLSHPDAVIYAKDLDGRYVLGNTAIHELYELTDGSLIGRSDHDVLPVAVADTFRRNDRDVTESDRRWVITEEFTRTDGTTRQYLSTKFPLHDENGEIYAVAGVSTDITAQSAADAALKQSERRWRQLFDESPVGIGLSDERGLFVAANPALLALFGRTEDEVLGHSSAEFTHPDDLESHLQATAIIRNAENGVARVEKRYVQPDGQTRWAWLTATHTPGPANEIWTLAHVQDVTDRLATEAAVRDSEANLSAVAAVVRQVQTGADARQTIVDACADLAQAASATLFELHPHRHTLRVTATTAPDKTRRHVVFDPADPHWQVFSSGVPAFLAGGPGESGAGTSGSGAETTGITARYLVPVQSGETVTGVIVVDWSTPVDGPDDRRAGVVTLLADQAGVALRQRALLSELEILAHTDTLTGLPNRRSWDATLARLVPRTGTDGPPLVIALIDFDHFKAFNDTRGHAAGDALLRDFARRARSTLKETDVLARWGGEEFALSLQHCAEPDIETVLQRVTASLPEGQTCSIGYAIAAPGEFVDDLMVRVDTALYLAKNTGRNRIQRHLV